MHDNVPVSARSPLERRRGAATAVWLPDFDTAALARGPGFHGADAARLASHVRAFGGPAGGLRDVGRPGMATARHTAGVPGRRSARFAAHPRPYARMAALDDPAADFAALAADPSPTVRWWARRNRHLPWQQLRALLATHPEDAAANPGLPPEVMRRLLDIAAIADVPPVDTRGPSRRPGAGSSAGS
ncbi:hypothetical protein ACU686_05450 [Yinghuangia aomiensis]